MIIVESYRALIRELKAPPCRTPGGTAQFRPWAVAGVEGAPESPIPHRLSPPNDAGQQTNGGRQTALGNAVRADHHGLGARDNRAKLPALAGRDRCQRQITLRSDHGIRPQRISRPVSDRATARETWRHRATENNA
jgi:hypothetical protein